MDRPGRARLRPSRWMERALHHGARTRDKGCQQHTEGRAGLGERGRPRRAGADADAGPGPGALPAPRPPGPAPARLTSAQPAANQHTRREPGPASGPVAPYKIHGGRRAWERREGNGTGRTGQGGGTRSWHRGSVPAAPPSGRAARQQECCSWPPGSCSP